MGHIYSWAFARGPCNGCVHTRTGVRVVPVSRLVGRAQEGDAEAFDDLVRLLSRRLHGYAYSLLGRQGDAEEAVQEAWVRAWTRLDSLRDRSGFIAWMFRMVRNLCMDAHRVRGRRSEDSLETVLDTALPTEARTPEELSVLRSEAEDALDVLRRLSMGEREAFTLVVLEELSYEEAAGIANVSVSTLRGRLARARVKIKNSATGGQP
ncbi:RNA polymerase sigma factor [Galactobacter valiniphilus]|uniref:RNA polymerase sigma factor n=1 Tax=Galactobacter valiniphilus TaxID=2676122 RepID=A0A399J776_9MICC|nr:RNA polymerase sigma factor [Galactobacter valiniphilus]